MYKPPSPYTTVEDIGHKKKVKSGCKLTFLQNIVHFGFSEEIFQIYQPFLLSTAGQDITSYFSSVD